MTVRRLPKEALMTTWTTSEARQRFRELLDRADSGRPTGINPARPGHGGRRSAARPRAAVGRHRDLPGGAAPVPCDHRHRSPVGRRVQRATRGSTWSAGRSLACTICSTPTCCLSPSGRGRSGCSPPRLGVRPCGRRLARVDPRTARGAWQRTSFVDVQVAAIAAANNLNVVTRNVEHFALLDVEVMSIVRTEIVLGITVGPSSKSRCSRGCRKGRRRPVPRRGCTSQASRDNCPLGDSERPPAAAVDQSRQRS